MEILLSALERQINIEKFKVDKREMMMANPICFNHPLQEANPKYLEELKKGYAILAYFNNPIEARTEFDLPDNLKPLFNRLLTQLRFHSISGKDETETVMHMVNIAELFYHDEFIPGLESKT